jgi:hypothetical protein
MPDFMFNIVALILVIAIPIVFYKFRSGGKDKHPMENGLTPIFQEQCGGRFDGLNLTIPLVRHALYKDFIAISYGKTQFILPYENITSAILRRHLFSKGITYSHNRTGIPISIIMWSRSPDTVLELLQAWHVQVTQM